VTPILGSTGGKDTNLVIAALLHDAIKECEVPRELIAETFGEDVASIVEEVTDDKSSLLVDLTKRVSKLRDRALTSAIGTKRTCQSLPATSALGGKSDIATQKGH
jgi:(p)ppGpp synthase/HD superfamily hydrolase